MEAIGKFIPVVFIPRKPHPNGLLIYLVVTYIINPLYSSKKRQSNPSWAHAGKDKKFRNHFLPIIVDIIPHLKASDTNPQAVVKKVMENWKFQGPKPHIITDSAFGSFELMKEVSEKGFYWTSSIPSDNNNPLWQVLSHNLATGSWRAAMKDNVIASCSVITSKKGKFVYKHVISNAFQTIPVDFGSTEPIADTDTQKSNVTYV